MWSQIDENGGKGAVAESHSGKRPHDDFDRSLWQWIQSHLAESLRHSLSSVLILPPVTASRDFRLARYHPLPCESSPSSSPCSLWLPYRVPPTHRRDSLFPRSSFRVF